VFRFLDKKTQAVAQLLFERAQEVDRRYLSLSLTESVTQVTSEFLPHLRFVTHDQAGFRYEDLPEFSFTIMWMLG